jgi:two-component system response regulator YesN
MYKIILIDDDLTTLEYLSKVLPLSELNFEVVGAFSDSLKAIEFIENNVVDAILSDIKMPSPDGVEIAKLCFENYPNIKVILISAHRDFEYAQSAIKYNVFRYITKPIDYEQTFAVLNELSHFLDKKNESNQFPENSEFSKRHRVFANLLCGFILDNDSLYSQLAEIGIKIDVSKDRCALLYFHIEDFLNYTEKIWKYEKEKLYNAISYLAPADDDDAYYIFTRYSWSNLEWIIIDKNNNKDFDKIVSDFSSTIINNLQTILNINATLTFCDNHKCIAELMRNDASTPINEKSTNRIVTIALSYMNTSYQENITLEDIAALTYMNPSYFSTYFKRVTGKGFIDMLTEIRVNKAAELLKSDELKIVDICTEVGYKNLTHFYSVFKQYYNVTPAKYKKIYNGSDKG